MKKLFPVILTLAIGRAVPSDYFVIHVTDEATGRGVPLIELKLPNEVRYWTDSAGIAAIRELAFERHDVFVAVSGHGYEFPKETFFGRGVTLTLKPGGRSEIKVRRTMIAERLYRLTGEGIYRDSSLAGLPAAIREPILSEGQVFGQDTAVETPYQGKLYWIWGGHHRASLLELQRHRGDQRIAGARRARPRRGRQLPLLH